jgi:hypothetical protein
MLIAAALLVAALGVGYLLFAKVNDPWRTMTPLPVQDYLQNANILRGNAYKLEATVTQSLEYSPTGGRLFSVDAGGEELPVLVPPKFNSINIERGQRFFFKIEVSDKGILQAQDVKKA